MKKIAIIGFGKIGQAIAANALQRGFSVLAIDTDILIAQRFHNHGFTTSEPGIEQVLVKAFSAGKLTISPDVDLADAKTAIISIPLAIDENKKTIDGPFINCFKKIVSYCNDRLLIIVETSVPVGYCRNVLLPVLTSAGKKHGLDFLLAHSPERIKSGTMLQQLTTVPKVIGGINDDAAEACRELYARLLRPEQLHVLGSIESAEMLKLAGMIYRDVNIALSNQLAIFANSAGIDFSSLIPLINTDNEAHLLQPGIGVGGHCTPVYPYFLIENFNQKGLEFTLAKSGRLINEAMPLFAYSLVKDKLRTKAALILGLSFRPNVREDANSTGRQLYALLEKEGINVAIHDAEFSADEIKNKGLNFGDIYATAAEVVFLVTMHREYASLDFEKLATCGVRYFVDGRNSISKEKVEAAGIRYLGIGR